MSDFGKGALAVFSAIITLAIISVIVSRKSDAPGLVQAVSSALSNVIKSAVTPIPPPAAGVNSENTIAPTQAGFWDGLLHQPFF